MDDRMYSWRDTTTLGVGDHTWVTTYQPGHGAPDPSQGDYWYCWGVPHATAIPVSEGSGGADFARKIAAPHDPKADVGMKYGSDGVCHQMANRLLRFCKDANGDPITVAGSIGYQLTVGMYGKYADKSPQKQCTIRWNEWVQKYINGEL